VDFHFIVLHSKETLSHIHTTLCGKKINKNQQTTIQLTCRRLYTILGDVNDCTVHDQRTVGN